MSIDVAKDGDQQVHRTPARFELASQFKKLESHTLVCHADRMFRIIATFAILCWPCLSVSSVAQEDQGTSLKRSRIRDFGVSPGILSPGPLNAITDVSGVRVGHSTLIEGERVRTGVTAIIPHHEDLFFDKTPAAVYVGNGYGKAAGFLQVQELGTLETPIILTNTLSIGAAVEATVKWTLKQDGHHSVRSVNAVVGETNDGYLNDIQGMHITADDVWAAIDSAEGGRVEEGNVGAGTGTRAFGFKGGIGTASRRLPESLGGYTVGVLVQTNFGGVLTIDGHRVGESLGVYSFRQSLQIEERESNQANLDGALSLRPEQDLAHEEDFAHEQELAHEDGSCMIVVATDAPLSDRNLERLARRAVLGLGRTGGFMSNGSGDFVIAFSTAYTISEGSDEAVQPTELLRNSAMSPLFLAVVESTEEAIYNSLVAAESMTGRDGNSAEALPHERLLEILDR